MTTAPQEAPSGLEGLIVTRTSIGDVRGEQGYFHYRGHDATDLARRHTLEAVWHLLLIGELPADNGQAFSALVATRRRKAAAAVLPLLANDEQWRGSADRMAALRTAWSRAALALEVRPWVDLSDDDRAEQALTLSAIGPVLAAATHREIHPSEVDDTPDSTAAAYLQLVHGQPVEQRLTAALERYLIATIDHGLNASTFTARIVTSTGADLGSVLVAALGALSGPLHGGAPSRALDMLDEIETPERADAWVREALAGGQRIMGFGHRVYRTEDPRAQLLRETAVELGGTRVELALQVEKTIKRILRELKPDRTLDVNVEYHAAVVLDAVGLPPQLFTPTFAISRAIGWMAHALEQMQGNRIVRPSSLYVGPQPARSVAAQGDHL